jgi:hypothetical protein
VLFGLITRSILNELCVIVTEMREKVQEKEKAISLRRAGASYREILKEVRVSKSTISNWLKDLPLTDNEKKYLRTRTDSNISRGRIKAATENRNKRIQREDLIRKEQEEVFKKYSNDTHFLLGVALYWAEGSNKFPQFHFVNSDPHMISFMYTWVQKYLIVLKKDVGVRIFMHKVYSKEKTELFWSNLLDIDRFKLKKTVFKPTSHKVKHNVNYNGCVRLEISGIEKYHTMMVWKNCLKKHTLTQITN